MKETLDRDHWISWRRRSEELALTLDEGDPVVITISPNGHDANASILARPGECKRVPMQHWFTIESLGSRSVLSYTVGNSKEEVADEDWYPRPRKGTSN
tara:strand:- start:84 stop:380 length:297 start_codon:yes stop_codon:yes gene_type:complete